MATPEIIVSGMQLRWDGEYFFGEVEYTAGHDGSNPFATVTIRMPFSMSDKSLPAETLLARLEAFAHQSVAADALLRFAPPARAAKPSSGP